MIPLTPEQREYKERTLAQLTANQARLEASLAHETRPEVIRSVQRQMAEIEAHLNRLQDELDGMVVFDASAAEELFKKSAAALAKSKFHLARRYITKLETIEPFYPGLERLKQEAETQQVSRRTRSIAAGTASGYSGATLPIPPVAGAMPEAAAFAPAPNYSEEASPWYKQLFQFHFVVSCLAVLLILCAVMGVFGMTVLQWLVGGGA